MGMNSKSTNEQNTVELRLLERLWNYENVFGETGVVRANEG